MTSWCETSSRYRDDATGRYCRAPQADDSSSSDSSCYGVQIPTPIQTPKKQVQPKTVNSTLKAPLRQDPGKIQQPTSAEEALLNNGFRKGYVKGKGKGKAAVSKLVCDYEGVLRKHQTTQESLVQEYQTTQESLRKDMLRAQDQHKKEVARIEMEWMQKYEEMQRRLGRARKELVQEKVSREMLERWNRTYESELLQLRSMVATLRCQGDNYTDSIKSSSPVAHVAAHGSEGVSPAATVATNEFDVSGTGVRDWGSAASTCTGSLHDESSITVRTSLDGVWSHSLGGQVLIKVAGDALTICNPHAGMGPASVPLSEFVKDDALAFGGHTGLLEGDAIRWSNGSIWTKLKTSDESDDAAVKKLLFCHAG